MEQYISDDRVKWIMGPYTEHVLPNASDGLDVDWETNK